MEEKNKQKVCTISEICGGCKYQNIEYSKQLELKTKQIRQKVSQELKTKVEVKNTIGMKDPYQYRNKAKFVFGYDEKRKPTMGFFQEGSHKIVNCKNCQIQNEQANKIASFLFELFKKYSVKIYNEDTIKGFIRHVIIRNAINTNEVMIILVTTDNKLFKRESIIKELLRKFPNIKTIVQNINMKRNSAVLGEKNINLYGKGYIFDYIKEYKFKISPLSFYQVNPIQSEVLYKTAIELAKLSKKDIVYDLYSGIGTISIFASSHAGKVYGIEIVKEAVTDAIENARLNKINNVKFMLGKVDIILPRLLSKENRVDVIFVDPPRVGLDKKTINTLLKILPKKIVYISCNPESLMQNLKEFENSYEVQQIQPVDMFPFTEHVECVSLLVRKTLEK